MCGLVTGTCFAEVGHQVTCVDNDAAKVKVLREGGLPIYEPGLEDLVKRNAAAGRLSFTSSTGEGVEKSDVIFIAVPTPPQPAVFRKQMLSARSIPAITTSCFTVMFAPDTKK